MRLTIVPRTPHRLSLLLHSLRDRAAGHTLRPAACALLALAAAGTAFAAPAKSPEARRLHGIFEREWQARLEASPLLATSVGVHDFNDRLARLDPESMAGRQRMWKGFLSELDAIDVSKLDENDRVNHAIFRAQLVNRIADYELGAHQIPFNADSGFYTAFARLASRVPFRNTRDYRNYIARLRAWPRHAGEQIEHMRAGMERGMTQPRAVLDGIDEVIRAHVVENPEESVFFEPFRRFPDAVPEAERAALARDGGEAIARAVVPGYRRLHEFMTGTYLPGARKTLGASDLPDGEAFYARQILRYTTLEASPGEIHEIGLAEVARIRSEMDQVIEETGFQGTFQEFLEFLRTDPRFYAKTPEELLMRAAWIAKTMDGKLPALFGTIPRLPYTVEPVPDDIAPKYTAGRYVNAPVGSTRPGIYWVNTYALETRPLYNLEALTLHEAVPGHHFQIALNQELEDLPPFRRFSYISAFGEGWGLYSERLGLEAGFYTDPYSNFGRLTYEMWRACRLVVDTGVHAFGWSREKALDFLASNTALSLHEVTTEIDRYISWPGQALAYKMGEIKIRELRQRAEQALGNRFDVRAFHDAVLRNGSVPLSVLESVIDEWIRDEWIRAQERDMAS